jgi:hypothetical protein
MDRVSATVKLPGRCGVALAALIAASVTAGCRQPLQQTQSSSDALARAVLSALERRDVDALRALAVNEGEFRDVVWPELPAARPERNLSAEYVWSDLRVKSEAGLRRILAEHGGRALTFVRVGFNGKTSQYRSYLVHREAIITARDADLGESTVQMFGSILERDGHFKVFSYAVD